jgi:uncharacterized membrane protein YeaQ/YmgE (transglycosylase-associated protein family)
VEIEPLYAIFLWPMLGAASGILATICFKNPSVIAAAGNVVIAVTGAALGGLVTVAFTHGEPESGGFWTSLVTSVLGTLVTLGLWRAWLDRMAKVTPAMAAADQPVRH